MYEQTISLRDAKTDKPEKSGSYIVYMFNEDGSLLMATDVEYSMEHELWNARDSEDFVSAVKHSLKPDYWSEVISLPPLKTTCTIEVETDAGTFKLTSSNEEKAIEIAELLNDTFDDLFVSITVETSRI